MYLPLLEEAIGQEAWPRAVVTHLDLETPGQTLARMEGNIAVIARVSSMEAWIHGCMLRFEILRHMSQALNVA